MKTVIINGGEPLKDCPTDWDKAREWEENANRNENYPQWKWDCGFKLDYDGGLIHVESRFYPPKTFYRETWDGNIRIYFLDELLVKKKFDCKTLVELKKEVESFVLGYLSRRFKL